MFRARLTQARDIIRDLGLRPGLGTALRWCPRAAIPRPGEPARRGLRRGESAGARCAVLREEDLRAFVHGCRGVSARDVRRRWRAQEECLVCWIGAEVAAYRWDTTGAAYLPTWAAASGAAPTDGYRASTAGRSRADAARAPGAYSWRRGLGARASRGSSGWWASSPSGTEGASRGPPPWDGTRWAWSATAWTARGRRYFVEGALGPRRGRGCHSARGALRSGRRAPGSRSRE